MKYAVGEIQSPVDPLLSDYNSRTARLSVKAPFLYQNGSVPRPGTRRRLRAQTPPAACSSARIFSAPRFIEYFSAKQRGARVKASKPCLGQSQPTDSLFTVGINPALSGEPRIDLD
ncbi:hypothetical protein [Burkholderia stabilis]|uniref:hypothetical protein n=1 Tax=Burkholderia stabilis TaxID=95485 RepID=UPI00158FDB45|nr:hypothetical protein [Burkholderia stabilis]